MQEMLDTGVIEEFRIVDGEGRAVTAIRRREKDGNVVPSDERT